MLKPRDGAEKDEGELTGGKRLIKRLRKRHGHFADVIVADALYLNAPFINTIKENGKKAERWMWLVTTLEQAAPRGLWEMMNRR